MKFTLGFHQPTMSRKERNAYNNDVYNNNL